MMSGVEKEGEEGKIKVWVLFCALLKREKKKKKGPLIRNTQAPPCPISLCQPQSSEKYYLGLLI